MPMYEFTCGDCGVEFEELTPADKAEAACPECGSNKTQRALSSSFGTHKRSKLVKWHRLPGRKYKRPKPKPSA